MSHYKFNRCNDIRNNEFTQDNTKLYQQLNSVFKRITNWNKCSTRNLNLNPDRNLDYLVSPSFQQRMAGVNRLFT